MAPKSKRASAKKSTEADAFRGMKYAKKHTLSQANRKVHVADKNSTCTWYARKKPTYLAAKAELDDLVGAPVVGFASSSTFDRAGEKAADKNQDIRFSNDAIYKLVDAINLQTIRLYRSAADILETEAAMRIERKLKTRPRCTLNPTDFMTAMRLGLRSLGSESLRGSTLTPHALSHTSMPVSRTGGAGKGGKGGKGKGSKSKKRPPRESLMTRAATKNIAQWETAIPNCRMAITALYSAKGDGLINQWQIGTIRAIMARCLLVMRSGIVGKTSRISGEVMRYVLTECGIPVVGFGTHDRPKKEAKHKSLATTKYASKSKAASKSKSKAGKAKAGKTKPKSKSGKAKGGKAKGGKAKPHPSGKAPRGKANRKKAAKKVHEPKEYADD